MFYDAEMVELMKKLYRAEPRKAEDSPEMADYPEFHGTLPEHRQSQFGRDLWTNPHE